jgi:NAD(P)H dehydrogenase (quinone)
MKIKTIFYSTYGHMWQMAQAAVEGAKEVSGAQVDLLRFPETLSQEIIEAQGAAEPQKQMSDIPEATLDDLRDADGFIFGVPTRFGNMLGQARAFFDSTGPLWQKGELIGKVAGVMSSSATQHGGQETTIVSTQYTLLHHGVVIVGLPYSFQGQMRMDEITGGSPYGASTITGGDGSRMPSESELDAARFQGRRVAEITRKIHG